MKLKLFLNINLIRIETAFVALSVIWGTAAAAQTPPESLVLPQAEIRAAFEGQEISSRPRQVRSRLEIQHISFLSSDKKFFGREEENLANFSALGLGADYKKGRAQVTGRALFVPQEEKFYLHLPEASLRFELADSILWTGRHLHTWSKADTFWNLGAWQPRFLWDYNNPVEEGFVGAFWSTAQGLQTFTVAVMPIFIPDISSDYTEEGGKIKAVSPWFRTPPRAIELWGTEMPLSASVDEPQIADVAFSPSVAIQTERAWNEAWRSRLGYAYKPINQVRFTFDYHYQLSEGENSEVDVTIHPQYPYEHVANLETDFQSGPWSGTMGVMFQDPQLESTSQMRIAQDLTATTTATLQLRRALDSNSPVRGGALYGGLLKLWAQEPRDTGEHASEESLFDRRHTYFLAARLGYESRAWRMHNQIFKARLEGTYDAYQNGGLLRSGLAYEPRRDLRADLSVNLIGAVGSGFRDGYDNGPLRRFRANDDVSLKVAYVF